MKKVLTKQLEVDRRTILQNASMAIRDVYDAVVELVTNADDRYQILGCPGLIEIEVERRKGQPSILRVRDFADGMTSSVMEEKLSRMGGRVSGLEDGLAVRGTNSRGAKDVASLGLVRFESIAEDGHYHKCEINKLFEFSLWESQNASRKQRRELGIKSDTGTLVTVEIEKKSRIPRHDNLLKKLRRLVPLREILLDQDRKVILRDSGSGKEDAVKAPRIEGVERCKKSFEVPGYPGATAKLIVKRARKRFDREQDKFRLGGIIIQSRHAIHEATLFDPAFENDPNALWFFGKLRCAYIDDLWNEFDELYAAGKKYDEINPCPVIDPSRRSGLTRNHPFVQELFRQVLTKLRPLVEEERQREENRRAEIESEDTRRRLNALEKAATSFMREFSDEEAPSRDPDSRKAESVFVEKGYFLYPPFAQIVVGETQKFWFNVNQTAFPEIGDGTEIDIECVTDDLRSERSSCPLTQHPMQDKVLRAVWGVKALNAIDTTGVEVKVGAISATSVIEVLGSEADRYRGITELKFQKKQYRMRTDAGRKRIKLLAPLDLAPDNTNVEIELTGNSFEVKGQHILRHESALGISVCKFSLVSDGTEARETMTARVGEFVATAEVISFQPLGAGLEIRIEDTDMGDSRYKWRQNVLEIAARHPSIKRYLGSKKDGYPGQDEKHFRLLIAEIVSEAVCSQIVSKNVEMNPNTYANAGWDVLYAEYCRLMTKFLPITHRLQCPSREV